MTARKAKRNNPHVTAIMSEEEEDKHIAAANQLHDREAAFRRVGLYLAQISTWDGRASTCPRDLAWKGLEEHIMISAELYHKKRKAILVEAISWLDLKHKELEVGAKLKLVMERMDSRASAPCIYKIKKRAGLGDRPAKELLAILFSTDAAEVDLSPWRTLLTSEKQQQNLHEVARAALAEYANWQRDWEIPMKHCLNFFLKSGLRGNTAELLEQQALRMREGNRDRQRRLRARKGGRNRVQQMVEKLRQAVIHES